MRREDRSKWKTLVARKPEADSVQDFQNEQEARTVQHHGKFTIGSGRPQRATDHPGKQAKRALGALQQAMEKQTKGRLKKAFGGRDKNRMFASEQEKEMGPMEAIVHRD